MAWYYHEKDRNFPFSAVETVNVDHGNNVLTCLAGSHTIPGGNTTMDGR